MRLKTLLTTLTTFGILFSFTVSMAEEMTEKSTLVPSAFLPADKYEFEPVLEGTETLHDYIIQNKGTAPLKIERVKTG
ncbi:MAG: DUF1573 domain-containing protein [Desulfobacterales bacterium]|nr:DUF1573 domain-containing protein [Desulfobacterales bacterium]